MEANDTKAMREALDKIARCMDAILVRTELDDPIHRKALEAQNIADGYLPPPRNCDVGTAEEQGRRFALFCLSASNCRKCPIHDVQCKSPHRPPCAIRWAQMPYAEGEATHGNA